jgi:transglutaminase-like putative cysteine protease
MSLDRALQLLIASLTILGAVFVGQGNEGAHVPAATAFAAVAAVAVTDVLGLVRLNRWLANLIAIVAVGWSLREFFQLASDEKLMAIANMLCYLQIVLLFQEKSPRVYWQLLVLSILQVVVGAALDVGPQFAILLGLYAVLALSALILLCVYREARRTALAKTELSAESRPSWQVLLANPEVAPRGAVEVELARGLTALTLVRQIGLLAAVTLLFSVVFFYATPRLSDGAWQVGNPGGGVAGFRPEARIAEGGRVHLTSQVVMRVALSRMSDRRPIVLVGEPYFHGEVLTEYRPDEQGSRWLPWRPSGPYEGRRRSAFATMAPQTTHNLVRQDIILEASTSNRKFAIVPTQPLWDLAIVPYGSPPRGENETFSIPRQQRYSAVTPAIRSDRQLHAIPNPRTLSDPVAFSAEMQRALAFDHERFAGLAETAARVLEDQEVTEARTLDKILALERHFHVPGSYHYSLNLNFPRDRELDPIEDFVNNHHTGHCQYFASALVLMLRSQGIPARMVVGYRGGAFNSVGNYYVVQGRHSHAWVEALLPPDEVPEWEVAGVPSDSGAWYRLDPTPSREWRATSNENGIGAHVAQAFDYVDLLWRDYVLSLNNNRQEDLVYDPLTAKIAILPSWVESRPFQRWLRRLNARLGLDFSFPRQRGGPRVFEAGLAVMVIGGLLLLLIVVQGLRLAGRALSRWRRAHFGRGVAQPPAFYVRLERLLARLPVVRRRGQTPRELAVAASNRLAAADHAALAAHVPPEVVAAYYRVRFGGDRLDKNEMDEIEQALAGLAGAVRKRSKA